MHGSLDWEYTEKNAAARADINATCDTTLKNLDSEMNDILSSKQLNDEEKAKLYNQVLQRYLTYYDQRKGQPLHVKLATPKSLETPKPEESEESSKESTEEENTIPTVVEEEVMKSVPKLYKTGARQLLDKIKENRMSCIGIKRGN